MKLFLVTRNDDTDRDETNAVLVRAKDEAGAMALALEDRVYPGSGRHPEWITPRYAGLRKENLVITEVTGDGEPEVIIHDYYGG